ncbi:MAG: J domain-containing protein [Acidobacteria bacterium]|nr:J domain-containing protein [Acidobacteriota bacterium]
MRKYTHYEMLGVPQGATKAVIKNAFREKVKLYHPDLTPGVDGSRFQAIVEAWDVLSDPWKRKNYDRELQESAPEKTWNRRKGSA